MFSSVGFGIPTAVARYRWQDEAGKWQLTDEAPPGESIQVYALETRLMPYPAAIELPKAAEMKASLQDSLGLDELPDLLNKAKQVVEQINAQRAMQGRVLSELNGKN